ncbi:hypothetical protein PtA15_5A163 [Puccinia triticina]|uniref:Uncharacterized protein n=1 Tax=Puccinia triticina TaxID=208348 RepID=A0ABY7CLA8_9BASI|nr:uncharacterized protein PtA15_5A163 [Puccinia triticina]WAQ84590.1 hypothetical protein PtA15_5A163 [Puccinia triticina]
MLWEMHSKAARARLAVAGVGDQARYAFWCRGSGSPAEERSVMCKLVEVKRPAAASHSKPSPPAGELKVLVRTCSGWMDLNGYLRDFLNAS